jgi:hypothetical protein
MLIDAILLERSAPTTPPGRQGFLTPMYLVAQRTGRVRLTAGRPPFGLMAAMWRSCGNDRQKDAIARSCPLSRVSRISRCRRDRCALRYDQQFVISGPLPSWRGKPGGTRGRAPPSNVVAGRQAPVHHVAFGVACDAAQADMVTTLARKGCGRPRKSIAIISVRSIFERAARAARTCGLRCGLRCRRSERDAGQRDQTCRPGTRRTAPRSAPPPLGRAPARQSAAMPARRCKFLTREAGR